MRKTFIMAAACCVLLGSCGSIGGLGTGTASANQTSTSGTATSSTGSVLGNILSSVIGLDKLTQKSIIKTWNYNGPACAFTSENLLAKAGGEIAASKVEEKLSSQYSKLGLSASNTYIEFKEDGTFAAKIKGKAWNGSYTYSESDGQIQLKGLLFSMNGYLKKETGGIALLFESKKLLTLIQTMTALSGSQQAQTIGDIANSYDGVRVGFMLK